MGRAPITINSREELESIASELGGELRFGEGGAWPANTPMAEGALPTGLFVPAEGNPETGYTPEPGQMDFIPVAFPPGALPR